MDLDAWKIKVDKSLADIHGAMADVLQKAGGMTQAPAAAAPSEHAEALEAAVSQLIEAHEAVRTTDIAPGSDTIEDLNERIQGANSVFDLSRVPLGAFKSGFANLVQRLNALEQKVLRPAVTAEWHPGDTPAA